MSAPRVLPAPWRAQVSSTGWWRGMSATVRAWLPRGGMLRERTWAHRHALITRFALLQALGLGVFALVAGQGVVGAVIAVAVPGAPALVGLSRTASRKIRMLSVVVSLMFASATLVDLTHGLTEAHFHFFVMLGVVSLYQDWAAFGLCVVITVLHHAVMGIASPGDVFAGSDQRHHPVQWAIVHGAFILAASITHMIAWKLNEQQELRDPLTQLPNRASFGERLEAKLRDTQGAVSVLFVDIDNFKTINDSGGHHAGDAALAHAAALMAATVRTGDMVARIGGDEFAVLLDGDADRATSVGERISAALRAPVKVDGRDVFVTASIGVADTELAGSRAAEDLLRDADLAMYVAKSSGKNRVVTYTEGVDRTVREQAELLQDLKLAIDLDQLDIHYQPVVRASDRGMCGVEALLRWHHPTHGLIPPDVFIPLAEESGEIKAIGAWVLRTATAQVAQWHREIPGCERLELAVNLSAAQLRDPNLLSVIAAALHGSGLPAGCLLLEVTESMLLSDLDLARRQLDAVRTLGAHVSIDDFGTGYSSLSYLARLPADQVKIDRSFVSDLAPGAPSIALVRAIVDMATALGLDIQAEGVEHAGQERILDDLGCPRSQGFLYSRPLASAAFHRFATQLAEQGTLSAGPELIPLEAS